MLELLPPTASYLGVDVSPVMVALATNRLAGWGDRAQVRLVDGSMPLPADSNSTDRIVCTYIFDLLDDTDAAAVLDEFERILTPDGLLCLVSLRAGLTRFERLVSGLWTNAVATCPATVGRLSADPAGSGAGPTMGTSPSACCPLVGFGLRSGRGHATTKPVDADIMTAAPPASCARSLAPARPGWSVRQFKHAARGRDILRAGLSACLQGMGRGPETRIKRPARRIRDIHQGGLSFDRERTTTLCAGERLCRFVTSWENPSVSTRVSLVPIAPLGKRPDSRDGQDRQHQADIRGRRFLIEYETLSLA